VEQCEPEQEGDGPVPIPLVEFLTTRLDEDEQTARLAARMAAAQQVKVDAGDESMTTRLMPLLNDMLDDEAVRAYLLDPPRHAGANDPARMLREVEAKRAIVESAAMPVAATQEARLGWEAQGDTILRALATVYSDHPDYRDEWRP
jgi:hypothetical protein